MLRDPAFDRRRRYLPIVSLLFALYFYFTEVAFASTSRFLLPGSTNEVRDLDSTPAYNYCYALAFLPFTFFLGYAKQSMLTPFNTGIAFFVGVLVLITSSSYMQLMCAYSSRDMGELCDLAVDIQHGVESQFGPDKMWLIKGNLMAIARNQSDINYLIANDHDFDYCASPSLFEGDALAKWLDSKNYMYAKGIINERGTRKVTVYPRHFSTAKYHSGYPMVDIDECTEVPLTKAKGCNGATFNLVDDYVGWLTKEYGEKWRVPINLNHKGLCFLNPYW